MNSLGLQPGKEGLPQRAHSHDLPIRRRSWFPMLHASLVQGRTVTGWSFEVPYHQISPKDDSFGWSKNKTEQDLDTVLLSFHVNWIRQVTAREKQQVFLSSHVRRVRPSKWQSRSFLPSPPLKTLVLTITHGKECLHGNLKVQWRSSCTLLEQNKIQDWMHWRRWDRTVSLYSINPRRGSSAKRAVVTLNCSQRKARAREWTPGCPSWMGHHPLLPLPMQNTERAASRGTQSRPFTGHQRDGFLLTAVWTPSRSPPTKHRERLACEYPQLAHRHPPVLHSTAPTPPHPWLMLCASLRVMSVSLCRSQGSGTRSRHTNLCIQQSVPWESKREAVSAWPGFAGWREGRQSKHSLLRGSRKCGVGISIERLWESIRIGRDFSAEASQ